MIGAYLYNNVVKRGKGYAVLEQNAGNVGNIDFTYFVLDNLPTNQDFDLQVTMVREEHDGLLQSGELYFLDLMQEGVLLTPGSMQDGPLSKLNENS